MSGMNKANARQESKNRAKFDGIRKSGVLDVHKQKAIAKHAHFVELKKLHPPKVAKGTARKLRRAHLNKLFA